MIEAKRSANAVWMRDLTTGSGRIDTRSSRAMTAQPYTWASRTAGESAQTSPEELLASAHASCFAMALANELQVAGMDPSKVTVGAAVTFASAGVGFAISKSALTVSVRASGSRIAFDKAVNEAKMNCPVSKAMLGNVRIDVQAELHSEA